MGIVAVEKRTFSQRCVIAHQVEDATRCGGPCMRNVSKCLLSTSTSICSHLPTCSTLETNARGCTALSSVRPTYIWQSSKTLSDKLLQPRVLLLAHLKNNRWQRQQQPSGGIEHPSWPLGFRQPGNMVFKTARFLILLPAILDPC